MLLLSPPPLHIHTFHITCIQVWKHFIKSSVMAFSHCVAELPTSVTSSKRNLTSGTHFLPLKTSRRIPCTENQTVHRILPPQKFAHKHPRPEEDSNHVTYDSANLRHAATRIGSRIRWKLRLTALGYGLDDRRFKSWPGLGIFLFTTAYRPALGTTQLPIQWVPRGSFPGGKAAGAWSWPLS
jgi:hypothetical protein